MDQITDAKTFWRAIGSRAIGVAVVTAKGPQALQASLRSRRHTSPPARRPCWSRSAKAHRPWHRSSRAATLRSIMSPRPARTSQRVRRPGRAQGADRFLPGQWTTLKTSAPSLIGAVGVLDCELEEAIERRNTLIAIGRIVAFEQARGSQSGPSQIGLHQYGPAPGSPQACRAPADAAMAVPIPGSGDLSKVKQSGPFDKNFPPVRLEHVDQEPAGC